MKKASNDLGFWKVEEEKLLGQGTEEERAN